MKGDGENPIEYFRQVSPSMRRGEKEHGSCSVHHILVFRVDFSEDICLYKSV